MSVNLDIMCLAGIWQKEAVSKRTGGFQEELSIPKTLFQHH